MTLPHLVLLPLSLRLHRMRRSCFCSAASHTMDLLHLSTMIFSFIRWRKTSGSRSPVRTAPYHEVAMHGVAVAVGESIFLEVSFQSFAPSSKTTDLNEVSSLLLSRVPSTITTISGDWSQRQESGQGKSRKARDRQQGVDIE